MSAIKSEMSITVAFQVQGFKRSGKFGNFLACSSPFSISVVVGMELVVKNPQIPLVCQSYEHDDIVIAMWLRIRVSIQCTESRKHKKPKVKDIQRKTQSESSSHKNRCTLESHVTALLPQLMQLLFQAIHCLQAEETFHGNFDKELKSCISNTYHLISNGTSKKILASFFISKQPLILLPSLGFLAI